MEEHLTATDTLPDEWLGGKIQLIANQETAPLRGLAPARLGCQRSGAHVREKHPAQALDQEETFQFGVLETFTWPNHI